MTTSVPAPDPTEADIRLLMEQRTACLVEIGRLRAESDSAARDVRLIDRRLEIMNFGQRGAA